MSPKNSFSKPQLLKFWEEVIDPRGVGMPNAIASEIGGFTDEPTERVLAKMATGGEDFKALWLSQQIDRQDARQVSHFYEEQFVEAYELAEWHCGRLNGEPPLNYAFAALLAKHLGLTRVLDFGPGIGSGSVAFATVGCEVHSADIAEQLLALVEHRMTQRGFTPRPIHLTQGALPPRGYFDLITCFDVLEHVPDQLAKLRELESYLRYGGYLVVNLMEDSSDPNRPMHISSAGNWLRLVRRTGLTPDWTYFDQGAQILVRTRTGHMHNLIGSFVDRLQGA